MASRRWSFPLNSRYANAIHSRFLRIRLHIFISWRRSVLWNANVGGSHIAISRLGARRRLITGRLSNQHLLARRSMTPTIPRRIQVSPKKAFLFELLAIPEMFLLSSSIFNLSFTLIFPDFDSQIDFFWNFI